MTTHLLLPLNIGSLTLKNRVVFTPLMPTRTVPGVTPSPQLNTFCHAQYSSAGLTVVLGVTVCPEGQGHTYTPCLYSAEQIAGWKAVTDAIHEAGSLISAQLWHVGRVSHRSLQPNNYSPLAPSAIRAKTEVFISDSQGTDIRAPTASPREMTQADIRITQLAFVDAAVNAIAAGFDLVEIHGAGGYLIEQFLATGTNLRKDNYGGSLESRARFLLEIVDMLIAALGAERIGVRLSPWGTFNDIEDNEPHAMALYLAEELNHRNIAYLHLVEWPPGGGPDSPEDFHRWLRAAFKKPLIVCGNHDPKNSEQILLQGLADAVSMTAPVVARMGTTSSGSKPPETASWI